MNWKIINFNRRLCENGALQAIGPRWFIHSHSRTSLLQLKNGKSIWSHRPVRSVWGSAFKGINQLNDFLEFSKFSEKIDNTIRNGQERNIFWKSYHQKIWRFFIWQNWKHISCADFAWNSKKFELLQLRQKMSSRF